ncbi:MAG: diguanylate cyclase, partial [Planctomycetes bacterium]|nr:diguanylate cyclase [Planctomycetota bacterium]
MVANGSALRGWYRTRGDAAPRRVSRRGTRRAMQRAGVLALLWALPPALLFPTATPEQQLYLTAITTGMMCAGGFALSTIRGAGSAFPLVLGGGAAIALLRSDLDIAAPLLALLVLYAITVVVSVVLTSDTFRARVVAELRAEQQSQVIGLLLRDFEQHAADVLWELDAGLTLQGVSEKLASFLDVPRPALEDCEMLALLRERQDGLHGELREAGAAGLRRLADALASARPFRDIELPLLRDGGEAWWSFTAKPLAGGGWRGVVSDVTVAQNARRHVWHLAHHDPVTGLANRRRFREALAEAVSEAARGTCTNALICIDLDGFKAVNDGFGHSLGDRLLAVVADRLTRHSRDGDLVARLGGDEFGVILRRVERPAAAVEAATRILHGLQEPCEVDGVTVPVGACLGLAFCPGDGDDPDTLLRHADLALYAAKEGGRGQVRVFSPDMGARVSDRLRMERALADALPERQLRLAFQPKRDLRTGEIAG